MWRSEPRETLKFKVNCSHLLSLLMKSLYFAIEKWACNEVNFYLFVVLPDY